MTLPAATDVSITGTGLFTPPESVSNAELVVSLTESTLKWNVENAEEIASGEVAERAGELSQDRPVVAICHAGRRSALACKILQKQGFERVANISGGMVSWRLLGLPVADPEAGGT